MTLKISRLFLAITFIFFLSGSNLKAMSEVEWSYKGDTGPAYWYELSEDFSACSSGGLQSPIDIVDTKRSSIKPIKFFYYKSLRMALENTGNTVTVDFGEGNDIIIGKTSYKLQEIKFHTPSEHTINGEQFPMEIEFLHISRSHLGANISVFVNEGEENKYFKQIVKYLPKNKNDFDVFFHKNLSPDYLLPKNREYYKYTGSLTTPPCTEGVGWFLLKEPINMSIEQINAIKEAVGTNNRPIQPTNNRNIRENFKKEVAPVKAPTAEPAEETAEEVSETKDNDSEAEANSETSVEAPVEEEVESEVEVATEEAEESEIEEIETEIIEESIVEDIELEESSEVIVE